LYQGSTQLNSPVGGTGSAITLPAGVLMPGSYTLSVRAINPTTGCSTELDNAASITVNPLPAVTLNSSNGNDPICPGETVIFTANSLSAIHFEFFVGGVSRQSGTSNTFAISTLVNNQVVNVVATSAASCRKQSNDVLININPLIVTLSSSEADNSICAGESVTFMASANLTTVSNYEFFVNGTTVQNGASPSYTTSLLTNGQTVSVKATTASGCTALSNGVTTFVNVLTATLSSSDSDNTICSGEQVTFTANAPTATTYEFFVNGVSVQNSATNLYTTSALTNAQTLTVRATTASGCSALSSGIVTTVNALPVVTLTSSDSDNTICAGEQVTFTASSATAVSYEFFVDGISRQNSSSAQFITNSLANGQSVRVNALTAEGCSTMSSTISNTVNAIPLVTLTSSDADNSICPGELVTFTASSASANMFDFFINGTLVQQSASNIYKTDGLTNGQTITVRATTLSACSATSSGITFSVTDFTVSLSSSDTDNSICPGETIIFTAASTSATNFDFYINGLLSQSGTANTYTTNTLSNGQTIYVRAVSGNCSLVSNSIITTVEALAVTLNSSDSDNRICQGDIVTFTAQASNAATYEFFVEGVSKQNSTSTQYFASDLTDGQNVWVIARTASGCLASSNTMKIIVETLSVNLTSSDSDNTICAGEQLTFTASSATAVNYEFFVNGVSVQNSATNLYTTSALTNAQTLTVRATTASGCTALSSGIVTTVNPLPVVTLTSSDSDNTICSGELVIFTASSAIAITYTFMVNGMIVQSGLANTYTTQSLTNAQTVTVRVTTANACSTLSNGIATAVYSLPIQRLHFHMGRLLL
jgi:hypothetical protein